MATRRLRLVDPNQGRPRPAKGETMKVAFATHDRSTVDAHFASARTFLLYEVAAEDASFVEAVQFDEVSAEDGRHAEDGEDRLSAKIAALDGCALLFVRAIGGPAAARVVRAHVHPIKLPAPEPIQTVIARVQGMLSGNPPPWLRKVLRGAAAGSDRFIDDED